MSGAPVVAAPTAPLTRRGQLALLLQELLTATVRLRARRDDAPTDVEAFRAQVRKLIATANRDARQLGYSDQDVGYALYSAVAFLDETILSLGHPAFRSWQGRPLQEEVFGVHVGGDVFFQYLETLLASDDSDDLADVLEVFELCLLLGFRGRYGGVQDEGLHMWITRTHDRLTRIRGALPPFAPNWAPAEGERARRARDPWQRRLLLAFGITLGIAIALWVTFGVILGSASRTIVARGSL